MLPATCYVLHESVGEAGCTWAHGTSRGPGQRQVDVIISDTICGQLVHTIVDTPGDHKGCGFTL